MPRLVIITTAPIALRNLCVGQLKFFKDAGYEVTAISAPGEDLDFAAQREGVEAVGIPMEREISPLADLVTLWRMWRTLRRLRPDVVAAATAKAALIGLLAARLARVPVRVYMLWGLRLETVSGLKRRILAFTERLAAACAQCVLCVSESLRREFVEAGYAPREKTVVLLQGSSNGIVAADYELTPDKIALAQTFRQQWGVPPGDPVVGFVGRFVRDKGIVELVDAFQRVLEQHPSAWLLLVGQYESGDPIPDKYVQMIATHPRIIRPGWVKDVSPYYGAMNVLALPTYREGFPNVVLHAAAAGLPVVGFKSTGSVDAVVDGQTGTLVDTGDSRGLAEAISRYLAAPELAKEHGLAGRRRVIADFQPEPLWHAMDELFRQLLARGRPAPSSSVTSSLEKT